MPFQDFTRRLQGPPQPLTLPEYDLPTQIEPMVDEHQAAVEKIFGKSRPNFAVDVPDNWNVEEQKPQAQPGKPQKYQTLKDLLPKQQRKAKTISAKKPGANTGTMPGTVTARNPLTGSAFDPRPRANNEFDLSLGGPTEAEQMAERALVASGQSAGGGTVSGGRKPSLLQKIQDQTARNTRDQRIRLEGVDTGETKFDPASLERTGELLRMRREFEKKNVLERYAERWLATGGGGLKPEEEFIHAPVNRAEDAVNSVLDSATRGLASIPEGFGRIADYVMNTDTLEATKGLAQMAKDPNLTPEERANIQARIDQLHGSLSKVGDYVEPISKAGDAAAKGLYPRDPNAEETINPLKADFWSHTMPGAAGSMLPFMAAGGVGSALKLSPRLVAGAAGAAMEVPEGYHEARAAGATPEQLQQVTATRIASGGIESLGAESLLGGVGKKLEGSMFGHVTKEGVVEAVQEGGQSATSDLGDKYYSQTKPELTAGQITMNALQNAVPALFLGAGGGAMGIPAHLAEQKQKQIAQQIEQLATAEPEHPVAQTIAAVGIDPTTVSKADDKAIEQLSIRLEAMARMDSQIQQIQGQQAQVQQQILNAQQAQQMGRVPSTVEAQAAQQAPVVEQQLVEAQAQQAAIVEDLQQNVSPLFKNLAKAIGKSDVQPIADVADDPKANLLTEVRKAGGISASEGTVEKGELDRLGIKEAGTTGIISRTGGESADQMRERIASEGLTTAETPQQFISEVEAATKQGKTGAETYADYQRSQMSEQEAADSDKLDEVLADNAHPFTQIYRALDNPKTIFTKDLAKKFDAAAQKAGFSDDFIERSLVEFQNQRSINGRVELDVGKNAEKPGRSMKSSEPGTSVSMSPFNVLKANNKESFDKLHKLNLTSPEARAEIAKIRDWARANNISQHHVGNELSNIEEIHKKYGLPKNPDTQPTQPTVKPSQVVTVPVKTEAAAPSSGFSQEQRKLLGTDHTNLLDSEFDEYLKQLQDLQQKVVRGVEVKGIETDSREYKGLRSKIMEVKDEREKRRKAGRLPSLSSLENRPTKPKTLSKKELSQLVVEQERARKAAEAAKQAEEPKSAQVKMLLTRDDRQQLADLGYSKAEVDGMTPQGGAEIIASGRTKATAPKAELGEQLVEQAQTESVNNKQGINTWNVPQSVFVDESIERLKAQRKKEGKSLFTGKNIGGGMGSDTETNFQNKAKIAHREHVEEAIARGEKVSPEVLADYPDLAKAEPVNVPQATTEKSGAGVEVSKTVEDLRQRLLNADSVESLTDIMEAHNDLLDRLEPRKKEWLIEAADIRGKELTKGEKKSKSVKPVGASASEAKTEKPAGLRELPKVGDVKKEEGKEYKLDRIQRIGELDFELWESDGKWTMVTRDAESGEVFDGSVVTGTNADVMKRRYRTKTEQARFSSTDAPQTLGESSDVQAAEVEPVDRGEPAEKAAAAKSGKVEQDGDAPSTFPDTRSGRIAQQLADGKSLTNIQAVRKQFDTKIGTEAAKKLEEDIELAGVLAARQIVGKGLSTKETYAALLDLHNRMPNLNTRTSESVRDQAYSTPLPIAYVASRLAGITKETTVYEPTGGNGALVMEASPDNTTINDLNPQRVENLRAQGFEANKADATKVSLGAKVDVVIANPPFGTVKENGQSKQFETPFGKTAEIDHAIVFKALEAMADDGKAVLIVGGVNRMVTTRQARSDAYNQSAKRKFYPNLYDAYNVVDHFTIDGSMYAKQGAAWPVDVIVIDGRGKSARQYPAVDVPVIVRSYEELGNKISEGKVLDSTERQQSVGSGERTAARPGRLPGFDDSETSGSTEKGGRSGRSDVIRAPKSGISESPGTKQNQPVVRGTGDKSSAQQPAPERTGAEGKAAKAGSGVAETTIRENKPASVGERTDSGVGRASELITSRTRNVQGWGIDAKTSDGENVEITADNWKTGRKETAKVRLSEVGKTVRDLATVLDSLGLQRKYSEDERTQFVAGISDVLSDIRKDLAAKKPSLDQMFEEEFADMFGESKEAQPETTKPSLKQSADALMDLFGDKPAKTGQPASRKAPGFDESLYQKAKPQFEAALSTFEGLDDRAAIRELLNYLKSNYGERAETAIYRMKPYIIQFVEDRATPAETKPETKVEPRQKQVISEKSESSHAVYEPLSTARSLNVAIPKNMSGAVKAALANFEERHGSPDAYVADKLGYKPEEIEKYFSAEQADALALAVDNIEQGKGFVIGDQTGIGKGRINAGIIRYAIKNGKTPVFVTQKPALYADMIRDLKDIGMENIRPLITNSGEAIPLNDSATEWMHAAVDAKAKGDKVPKLPSDAKIFRAKADHVTILEQVGMSGKLKGYDAIFTTYDQMSPTGGLFNKERHGAVSSAARGGVLILDESHTAGGVAPSTRGGKEKPKGSKFFRELVKAAGSVFYSSATYAKRPDVMDLYSKTDLGLLGKTGNALAELFSKGGVALQQVVASKLAEAGQYLRRERTFDGITYAPEVVEVNKQHAENVSTAMRMIVAFDDAKRKAVSELKELVKANAEMVSEDGSIGKAGVDSSNFTSLMHNVIDQMLLGLKANQAADQAIKAIKNGERPVLTVSNTMESFLKDAGLSPGDAVDLSFKDVLMRYLQRSRDIVIKDRNGNETRRPLDDDELGGKGLAAFEAVQDFINESDFGDIPISPIDRVRELIEKAGYKVDEITGRGTRVDSTGAVPILRARSAQDTKVAGRRRVIGDFNNGRIDALILNQAGSTGISLHASPATGKDVKPRHMIIWQAEKNIDTHMQMLGRVNRTGQVTLPRYTQMIADVPAEKRPAAVLLKKMASLSANTTASRKSAVQTEGVTDFINELGDAVVARILSNDSELSNKLGDPLDYDGDELSNEGAARKVSGRIPLLTLAEQHEVYERIESEYADYLAQKEAMGENPLEARTEDFRAETISKEILTEGVPGSPFSEPAYLEKVKINRTVKPYTAAEISQMVREGLGLSETASESDVRQTAGAKISRFVEENREPYNSYKKSLSEGIAPEDAKGQAFALGQVQKAIKVANHWSTVARVALPGTAVTVNTDAGSVSGIVLDVFKRGKPKNPVALGSWVVRLAVLDGRELRISFNEMINKDGVLKVGQSPQVNRLNPETGMFESRPMLPEFDASQGTKKQTRYMVTGNIVSGYAALPKGQILNYTDAEGNVKQGVLLPGNFDAAATLANMAVELSTASQVIDFFDKVPGGKVSDSKQEVTITPEKRGTDLEIYVLSSKSIGGKYYLDKDLTAITGNFVKQGGLMKVSINRAKLPAVMAWLRDQGIGLNASHKKEAKELLGQSRTAPPASRRETAGPASQLANPMDVLLYQESIVKVRGSRGARMYVNDHARAILGASLTEVFGSDYSNVNAINLSREEVKKVADYLETEAKGLTGDYKVGAEGFVADLRELLSKNKTQRTFNIVDVTAYEARHQSGIRSDRERAAEQLKGDIREEGFHWSQREVSGQSVALVGSSWAQSSKGFGKYRKALLKLEYPDDPETLAAETAAKIAAGKFDDLGIKTEADHEQAQNWLASYFERVAEKHGIEALEKFDRLLPKAKEAKAKGAQSVKERLRERIEQEQAQSGGTNRPRSPGGQSERVRGADESGQKDGEAEVRRRSAEEPFESAEPVKGPQLTIDERTNAENVRRPGEKAPEFSSVKGARIQPKLFSEGEPAEGWVDPLDPESVEQTTLFGKDGMPKKTWGDMWANLADVLNLPKALRASGDLSAAGRQGWFLSIPPSRWAIAARSFGKGVRSSEAMGLKKGAYKALKRELTQHPAYRDMTAAGWIPMTSDSGELTAQTELFGSRFAGKIPWAKYSEQAYKMNLDWLALSTFELYKKGIDKSSRDLRERHEGYKAAVDWINVSSGRGSYSGRFGKWYKEKPAPFLNVIGWAPGLVYSRMQLLNPVTYAKNLKNPQSRVVFRKQMSELFQSGAVLFLTGALAKVGGALISTDPEEADFLKLRFGTTRYDVLAGLQQVARLGIRMGEWARTRATEDDSTEEGKKKLKKSANETTSALLRFGRTKLGPVPGFFIDWLNDWKKVTGERHAPGDFIGDFKEGENLRAIAEMTEDPIVSQVIPLFWADMVQAYEQGWRANGQEGGLTHAAKMLPAGLGLGVQDYDRPEWSPRTKLHLDAFELDPRFPTRKTGEREGDYQKRVRSHMAEQEKAIDQFADDPNLIGQPLERKKALLKQEMSDEGRERMSKIAPEDVADDRMVRAWIQIGVERLKANPVYQQMSEMEQKRAVQSYYGRMNRYKAQPANGQHEYLRPDTVDEDVLQQKIKAAISTQQDN